MKDPYEVLYRKEADLVRVREEIESLTLVATLLAESEQDSPEPDSIDGEASKKPSGFEGQAFLPLGEPQATGTDGPPPVILRPQKKSFWGALTGRG